MAESTRKAGRPAGKKGDKARKALLDAARRLFLRYEFKAVSIRAIADTAGVNPAMVHYYFGDKKGLYLAMVDATFLPLKEELEKLDKRHALSVEEFVRLYAGLMSRNPWWPNFFVREVLFGQGELRDTVVEKFGRTVVPRLLRMIREGQKEGRFRADLEPPAALLSLVGMTVFPFLVRPLARKLLDFQVNSDTAEALAAHTSKLFLQGIREDRRNGE